MTDDKLTGYSTQQVVLSFHYDANVPPRFADGTYGVLLPSHLWVTVAAGDEVLFGDDEVRARGEVVAIEGRLLRVRRTSPFEPVPA